jgi:hypothetical protein
VSRDALIDLVNQLVDQPRPRSQTNASIPSAIVELCRLDAAHFSKKAAVLARSREPYHRMADTADSLEVAISIAPSAFSPEPELILIVVRIRQIDDCAFVTLRGCLNWVAMRDLMLVEPAQVHIDVLRSDVEPASGLSVPSSLAGG